MLRLVQPADPDDPAEPAGPAFAILTDNQETAESATAAVARREPGFPDIEAAVELVALGWATRVVLTGFPAWPGLLWQASQLAESAGVEILATVVRPGGRVDLVVTRDNTAHG